MLGTPFTRRFGVDAPLIQAGMGEAGPDLAVAVLEAGGLGSLGTIGKSPKQVRRIPPESKRRCMLLPATLMVAARGTPGGGRA